MAGKNDKNDMKTNVMRVLDQKKIEKLPLVWYDIRKAAVFILCCVHSSITLHSALRTQHYFNMR